MSPILFQVPIHEFRGHRKEMSSVDWNLPKFSDSIVAASWDGTVCCVSSCSYYVVSKDSTYTTHILLKIEGLLTDYAADVLTTVPFSTTSPLLGPFSR
jgi:hypothetical protein